MRMCQRPPVPFLACLTSIKVVGCFGPIDRSTDPDDDGLIRPTCICQQEDTNTTPRALTHSIPFPQPTNPIHRNARRFIRWISGDRAGGSSCCSSSRRSRRRRQRALVTDNSTRAAPPPLNDGGAASTGHGQGGRAATTTPTAAPLLGGGGGGGGGAAAADARGPGLAHGGSGAGGGGRRGWGRGSPPRAA